jgi:hypothetical protein
VLQLVLRRPDDEKKSPQPTRSEASIPAPRLFGRIGHARDQLRNILRQRLHHLLQLLPELAEITRLADHIAEQLVDQGRKRHDRLQAERPGVAINRLPMRAFAMIAMVISYARPNRQPDKRPDLCPINDD